MLLKKSLGVFCPQIYRLFLHILPHTIWWRHLNLEFEKIMSDFFVCDFFFSYLGPGDSKNSSDSWMVKASEFFFVFYLWHSRIHIPKVGSSGVWQNFSLRSTSLHEKKCIRMPFSEDTFFVLALMLVWWWWIQDIGISLWRVGCWSCCSGWDLWEFCHGCWMNFLLHEVWLKSTLLCFRFGCWVLYMHLEAESGKMIVYGLGSCLYVLSVLEDEGAIVDIE